MDKTLYLSFQNKKIYARLAYPDDSKKYPGILFIHGAKNELALKNYSDIVEGLSKDFVFLAFNHLGNGKSEGNFEDYSLQSRVEQAMFMLSYLKKLPNVDKNKIAVIGSSMGGHVVSRLSGIEMFPYLILRAPASYRKDLEYKLMKQGWLSWDRERKYWPWKPSYAFEAIQKYKGNLLIIEHENDEIIPREIVDEYYKSAKNVRKKQLIILKGAPHKTSDLPGFSKEFTDAVIRFIRSNGV